MTIEDTAKPAACEQCGCSFLQVFFGMQENIHHMGLNETVDDLSGLSCADCGAKIFDNQSQKKLSCRMSGLISRARTSGLGGKFIRQAESKNQARKTAPVTYKSTFVPAVSGLDAISAKMDDLAVDGWVSFQVMEIILDGNAGFIVFSRRI
jgi:hypothetical protein